MNRTTPSASPHHIVAAGAATGALLAQGSVMARAGAWACDLADERLCWTDGVYDLFGVPRGSAIARADAAAMYDELSRDTMERLRADAIAACRPFTFDACLNAADGQRRWMRVWGDVEHRQGRAIAIHGFKQDVTAERLAIAALRHRADHDALTGLANRAAFQSGFLDRAPEGLAADGALVLFDLDGFKTINDRFGHDAGDACLRAVAARLGDALPDARLVARLGGDEFACVLPVGHGVLPLARRVARVIALLRSPVLWRGRLIAPGASAGIAFASDERRAAPDRWLTSADAALYAAKRAGGGAVRIAGGDDPAAGRLAAVG